MLLEQGDNFLGRVYIIASPVELTFEEIPDLNNISTETQLLNEKFKPTGDMQAALPHIYSTPYNLEVDGKYYGSFNSNYQKVPHLNLLLYHVAAKVDIKWYVPEDKRIDREMPDNGIRLTYMEAVNLFDGYAYCFRPMENEVASLSDEGHSILINDNIEGLWWEGRDYFYTIPYTTTAKPGYFPLQLVMKTNGSTGEGYRPTLYMKVNTASPFVPWLRADFNINSKLADGPSTIVVNE